MGSDLKTLLEIDDKIVAEDIQRILEESNIYSILVSDNPASSVLNVYFGSTTIEGIVIQVSRADYPKAIKIICNSCYKDLLANG